jgi:hypothetical protein
MDGTVYWMIDRMLLVLFIILNVLAALLNLYIGGWNLIVVPFSYGVALFCAYVLGRTS